jgi:tetratricopeptide (TPR) repeat protein
MRRGGLIHLLLAAVLAAAGCAAPSANLSPDALAGKTTPPGGVKADRSAPPKAEPAAAPEQKVAIVAPAGAPQPPPPPPRDPVEDVVALAAAVHRGLSAPSPSSGASSILDLARDLTGRIPSSPDAWLLLGWAGRRSGSPVVASAAFKKAYDLDRTRTEALFALSEMSAEAGTASGAHDHLARAWNDNPGPAVARRLAAADIATGRLDEARAVLAAAREAAPGDEELAADLSSVHDMAGDPAYALSVLPFREGMPTRLLLARTSLQMRQGNLEGAAVDLEKALAREDAGAGADLLLGVLKMQRGDLRGAEEQFRQVTAEHPDIPDGYLDLGLALRRQGRFADARAAYQAGLAAHASADLHLNLGVLFELYLGDKTVARDHYRRFVEMGGAGADRVRGWAEYLAPATGSESTPAGAAGRVP